MPLFMRPGLMGPRIGRPGLLGLAARTAVVAGTGAAVGGAVRRRQYANAEQQAEAQAYEQQAAAPAAPAPTSGDAADRRIEQLKDLASLHSQGVLTDDEFAQQKAAILAGR
ncbi:SHOCT domain-containing protein [Conexibacter woesei]|uniref:SHOCT domain-containing protein n=1 Tax=Conexibacter woesei TaxID=191495 RepID=UPI0004002A10|nr:SHOCT domain-containing protein [Conexibacter woesei]